MNHLDGLKTNNALSSLRWTSQSGSHRHAFASGLRSHARWRNPRAVLTPDQALVAAFDVGGGDSCAEVARRYGVTEGTIRALWSGPSRRD